MAGSPTQQFAFKSPDCDLQTIPSMLPGAQRGAAYGAVGGLSPSDG